MSNNKEVAEKNNQILRLGDQINGLLVYQEECERKDILINSLQEQVAKLEVCELFKKKLGIIVPCLGKGRNLDCFQTYVYLHGDIIMIAVVERI